MKEMMTPAIGVYRDRLHVWGEMAIWRVIGRLLVNVRNVDFSRPWKLCWWEPQCSAADLPAYRRYRFNHFLSRIVTKVTNSDIRKLAHRRFEVIMISAGRVEGSHDEGAWDGGSVEDRPEVGFGKFDGIRLEVLLDVNDTGTKVKLNNCGGQVGLGMWSTRHCDN